MNVLVINCGSSSLKYELLDTKEHRSLLAGKVERLGSEKTHSLAISELLDAVSALSIDAVGHRVVHGGKNFSDPALIDDRVLSAIEECLPLAPLHNPHNLAGIVAAMEHLPSIPHVAVFDTAFHHNLPRRARTYAIERQVAKRLGIRRFGFHGTSHAFVANQAALFLKTPLEQLRVITCHLGNGASVCAIESGHSVETSMGMTPLEGLVMGTRCGDLDPGVILNLLRQDNMTVDDVDDLLNRRSGLLGLSGCSNDLRDLEELAADGNEDARLAIAVFAHRVRKVIGAYTATMGGVDVVVMTAGIGENSTFMRRRILQRFEFLGLALDEVRNSDARVSHRQPVAEISSEFSRVRSLVIATHEELQIALETARVAEGRHTITTKGTIPIAVSARHVHLDEKTFRHLFGDDAELTEKKPLSQPGQFAANQTVGLIGPRRRIDGVRIIGPFRSANQVEISRTDEFHLGVDAPVRPSGCTQGSAPITLEGPKGTVQLSEGLICARRHIHMTPTDAEAYGVKNADEVTVAISGGVRDLVFGGVTVRVKSSYKLEMHIDTDEANAAELDRNDSGTLERLDLAEGKLLAR